MDSVTLKTAVLREVVKVTIKGYHHFYVEPELNIFKIMAEYQISNVVVERVAAHIHPAQILTEQNVTALFDRQFQLMLRLPGIPETI